MCSRPTRSRSDEHAVWWERIGAPCATSAACVRTKTRCARDCGAWRGSVVAGDTAGCMSCCNARSDESTTNGCIACIGRSGSRCADANANGLPTHRAAQWSRAGSAEKRGEAWSMDFMQDVLIDGRRYRTLNILDLVTRECLALEVDTSLPGQRVTRVFDQLVSWHGAPKTDHGRQRSRLRWASAGCLGLRAWRDPRLH